MAEIHFLQYNINLSDSAQVASLQGLTDVVGGAVGAVIKAPDQAAIDYEAPIIARNAEVVPPCINSEWFGTPDNFPTDVSTFERKTGGWFGISFLFGKKHRYYWRGHFNYVPPPDGGSPGPGTPDVLATRRFIQGFEISYPGGAGGGTPYAVSRTSSRHTQGLGASLREWTTIENHTTTEFSGGAAPAQSWERLYIRPRVFPSGTRQFWRARCSIGAAVGLALQITPTGQIALYTVNSASVYDLIGTCARSTVIDEWIRIDILLKFGVGAGVYVFLNGTAQISAPGLGGELDDVGGLHNSSEIGQTTAAGSGSLDIDDWFNADWPTSAPSMVNPGSDWLSGSRMALVRPTGFGTGNVWTGDWRVLLQSTVPEGTTGTTELTSVVNAAKLAVATDYALEVQGDPNGQIGIASFKVGVHSFRSAGALQGQVGYSIAGAAAVMTNMVEAAAPKWNYAMYRPVGLAVGQDLGTLELVHIKTADVNQSNVAALQAEVEVLGIFGPEDIPPTVSSFEALTYNGSTPNVHNAPYPRTPWATSRVPPISPIAIYAGTYVGNAAGVELSFKTPIHFWWVRRVTTLGAGIQWLSVLAAAHNALSEVTTAEGMVQALEDPNYVPAGGEDTQATSYLVRIVGANVQANNPGDTYVYTAVSDPGMRFLLCGGLKQTRGTATVDTPLSNPLFTPEAAFFFREPLANQPWYKGPGHAAASASELDAAETANAITFSQGHLAAQSAFHQGSLTNIGYALFRREDGNVQDDPTAPYSEVIQITSYTGDGSASRTVGLSPTSGKRPVFALVVPHNGAAVYRDHQHTGTTSTTIINTANASTGITGGGIDQISVGSALNSNGIVYDVFVLPGSDTAGLGGFSVGGEFFPRPPDTPVGGFDEEQPEDPEDVEPPDGGGDGDDDTTPIPVWPTGCVGATTQLINMALSRLGHTKFIVNVETDQTVEATLARLHYQDAMNAVLRAWPWPFATRYATLVNVPAVPATDWINEDWQYAYRAPADMAFARRFVEKASEGQRTWNHLPITFRVGADAVGLLIYSNEIPDNAVLEYTAKVSCPATAGDELFRSAFAWRMAHEMAPGMSKDAKAAAYCYAMYKEQLPTAETVAANEQQLDPDDHDASWIRAREGD